MPFGHARRLVARAPSPVLRPYSDIRPLLEHESIGWVSDIPINLTPGVVMHCGWWVLWASLCLGWRAVAGVDDRVCADVFDISNRTIIKVPFLNLPFWGQHL